MKEEPAGAVSGVMLNDRDSYLVIGQLKRSQKAASRYRDYIGDTPASAETKEAAREILGEARAILTKRVRSMPATRAKYEQALLCYLSPELLDTKEFAAVSYFAVVNLLREGLNETDPTEQRVRMREAREALGIWKDAETTGVAPATSNRERAKKPRGRNPKAQVLSPESMIAFAMSIGAQGGSTYEQFIREASIHFGYSQRPLTEMWTAVLKGYPEFAAEPLRARQLADFWPPRGPVWDGLGVSSDGLKILLEAKAHIAEAASPASAASEESLERIDSALQEARAWYAPRSVARWSGPLYQYANRLAFHYFLTKVNGIASRMVFLDFYNAADVAGPSSPEQWKGATEMIHALLGLPKDLSSRGVFHAYVDVQELSLLERDSRT